MRNFLFATTYLMAPTDKPGGGGAARTTAVEIDTRQRPNRTSAVADLGVPGAKPKGVARQAEGNSANLDRDATQAQTGMPPAKKDEEDETLPTDEEMAALAAEDDDDTPPADETTETDESQEGATELPAYDDADEEVQAAYDAHYTKDGQLDVSAGGAFTTEWFANAEKNGGKGSLNEDTYKYLEGLGYPRAMVKEIEAGQVARQSQIEGTMYTAAGGKERLGRMVNWGKTSLSEAARKRFNDAMDSNDAERIDEAITTLRSAFEKANPNDKPDAPTAENSERRARPGALKRPLSPTRQVRAQANPAGGGVQGFPDKAAWRAAHAEAVKSNDQSKFDLVRRRLKASKWYSGS